MGTSLADQLKRLSLPQTSLLLQEKRTPSLLFDPKEAANLNRETFYELGLSGLQELILLNKSFERFKLTLYDISSISHERSVQLKEANRKLDKDIKKFLLLLSPYFLLKPAHKALEWLINRFHVQSYNVDDLVMLALPYHETPMFVRVVQLVDLDDPTGRWHWLRALQKPGATLAKSVLLKQCSRHDHLLRIVCDTMLQALKVHASDPAVLSTLYAFYCTSVVGALETSKLVTELQVTHLLKSLLKGLLSPVTEFSAAALMITGQIARRSQLSLELLFNLINIVVKNNKVSKLFMERTLLLVLLYQTQNVLMNSKSIPEAALFILANDSDVMTSSLTSLAASNVHILPLLEALVYQSLRLIQAKHVEKSTKNQLKIFVTNLLTWLQLDGEDAKVVIQCSIEAFDSDTVKKRPLVAWYSNFFNLLERHHPLVFDAMVDEMLSDGCARDSSIQAILGFLPTCHTNSAVFQKLGHSHDKVRTEAIVYLRQNYKKLNEKNREMLAEDLPARMRDDSHSVVAAVLEFSAQDLLKMLGVERLLEELVLLVARCWHSGKQWLPVSESALPYLCQGKLNSSLLDTRIFIALFPYLLPTNEEEAGLARLILDSSLAEETDFLRAVASHDPNTASEICKCVFETLTSRGHLLPKPDALLEVVNSGKDSHDVTFAFSTTMFLCFSLPENVDPQLALSLVDTVVKLLEDVNVKKVDAEVFNAGQVSVWSKALRKGVYPLQGLVRCLLTLMERSLPGERLRWSPIQEAQGRVDACSLLVVKLFKQFISGCNSSRPKLQETYAECLNAFFRHYFPSLRQQVTFLCHLSVGKVDPKLQIQSLRLATALLKEDKASIDWSVKLADSTVIPALLVASSSPVSAVRSAGLGCIAAINNLVSRSIVPDNYTHLLDRLLRRREELSLDGNQMSLVIYASLSPETAVQDCIDKTRRQYMPKTLDALINCVLDNSIPDHVAAALLTLLRYVVSVSATSKLTPLGERLLDQGRDSGRLDKDRSEMLTKILSRLVEGGCLKTKACWTLLEKALRDDRTIIEVDGRETFPAEFAMGVISNELFAGLEEEFQRRLLETVVEIGTDSDQPGIVTAAGKMVKRISIEAEIVLPMLEAMQNVKNPEGAPVPGKIVRNVQRFKNIAPTVELLETLPWRRGITLLEFIQNKKKMQNVSVLLSALFGILKKCLQFESQAPVEYTKQLTLSCLLHCCQKLSPDGSKVPLSENVINIELVVECIRATQNPQTHHHALLVLSHTAGMIPEQVLHNIMSIFTFMGSSVFRQDDAYSFQVIEKIVDTIIPILVKSGDALSGPSQDLSNAVCGVLRVFVDALLDIPEHRRIPLFQKLLITLNPQHSLWLLICLVLESHVVRGSGGAGVDGVSKKLEFALGIAKQFDADAVICSSVKIMEYLQFLPTDKEENQPIITNKKKRKIQEVPSTMVGLTGLFDVERHTAKELRHLKYSITTFLTSLLSTTSFVEQVAVLSDTDILLMEPFYRDMLVNMLNYIETTSKESDSSCGKPTAKYWRIMLNQGYEIVDKVTALLPSEMFLSTIKSLLGHPIATVRRKAMELLNAKLHQQREFFNTTSTEVVCSVLPHLVNIIKTIRKPDPDDEPTPEVELNQQTALMSVKLLAHQLAAENPSKFQDIFRLVTALIISDIPYGNLLASLVLCLAEFCSCLRAHAITQLSLFMPTIILLLKKQQDMNSPDMILVSIITAVDKIVEAIPHFLSPYLEKLLQHVAILSAKWRETVDTPKRTLPVTNKLNAICIKIATSIQPRILIPAIGHCYSKLLDIGHYSAIGPLLGILSENFSSVPGSELNQLQSELITFFLAALTLRSDLDLDLEMLTEVEGHIVESLVGLVLKLSETSFRPLYYRLFHWATEATAKKDRAITFYRLSSCIAKTLKGLFVLFATHFLKNAASLLVSNNLTKTGTAFFDTDSPEVSEKKSILLVENILETLHSVFLYDSAHFVNKERFDTLMQPIVDQMENTMGGPAALQERSKKLITPCVAQFAFATADDVLWKQLNYQVLLKARHNLPQVRMSALETLCAVARKLGEDFLPLLPETIPFIAELLEDEEEEIEKASQKAVQDLEEVLGEPLQKYF